MIKEYLSKGFSIIPIKENEKTPLLRWEHFQKYRADENYIRLIQSKFKACNWAVVTGKVSDIVVLDFDNKELYQKALHVLPKGVPTVETRRGYHVYFKYNPEIKTSKYESLDIKSDGGYVLIPPSVVNAYEYKWHTPLNGNLVKISNKTIEDIIAHLYGYKPKIMKQVSDLYKGVNLGERNISLSKLCGSWLHDGLTLEECLEMGHIFADKCTPPMDYKEVEKTIQSIYKRHVTNEAMKSKLADYASKLLSFPLCHNKGSYSININATKRNFSFKWTIISSTIPDELTIITDNIMMKAIENGGNVDLKEYIEATSQEQVILCVNKLMSTNIILEYTNGKKFISIYNLFSDVNLSLNGDKKAVFRGINIKLNKPLHPNYYNLSFPARILYRNIIFGESDNYNINILTDRMMTIEDIEKFFDELRVNKIICGYTIDHELKNVKIL